MLSLTLPDHMKNPDVFALNIDVRHCRMSIVTVLFNASRTPDVGTRTDTSNNTIGTTARRHDGTTAHIGVGGALELLLHAFHINEYYNRHILYTNYNIILHNLTDEKTKLFTIV